MTTLTTRVLKLGTALIALLVVGLSMTNAPTAHAYTSNSYSPTITVTDTDTSLKGTDTMTLSWTMPMAMTTSGSVSVSMPYLYSYASSTYVSEQVSLANATMSSTAFSQSTKSDGYLTLTPKAAIASGTAVSVTLTGVKNPTTVEGSGTVSVSGYEYGTNTYNSFYGSQTIAYGSTDLEVTVTTTTGTVIPSVSVYLSYTSGSTYEYLTGITNSSGIASFSALTANRTYSVSCYYSGTLTTEKCFANTTLLYSGGTGSTKEKKTYTFVGNNVSAVYKDASGNAVSNAYYYVYNASYSVWQYGYTTSTGAISLALADGSYTLKVAESSTSYNYYTYTFTVTSGVDNLAATLTKPSPEVSGTVTAAGAAVSGASVTIRNADWSVYQTATTTSTGAFSFALGISGSFTLSVGSYGLPSGYFAPDSQTVTVTAGKANAALTLALTKASKTISGKITDGTNAITDAYVYAYQTSTYNYAQGTVDSAGAFSMTASKGTWSVYIYPTSYPSKWSAPSATSVTFANDDTTETKSITISVATYNSHIKGTFKFPDGTAVGANSLYCYAYGGDGGTTYSYAYTDAAGLVDLQVTKGTFNVYCYFYSISGSSNYVVPTIASQNVADNKTVELGTLTLETKNSKIEGAVKLKSTGEGQSGLSVYAYKEGDWSYAYATTDSSGKYSLLVGSGDWKVSINSWGLTNAAGQKLVYTGGSKSVKLKKDETVTGTDFDLTLADSTLAFTVVDSAGTTLTNEYGWVTISEEGGGTDGWYSLGCSISSGGCSVSGSNGKVYEVNYYSYGCWSYTYSDTAADTYTFSSMKVDGTAASTVTASSSATKNITLVMAKNDVTVSGSFLDESGNAVSITGDVVASNDGNGWASTYVSGASSYKLKLSAGTWKLSYNTFGSYVNKGEATIEVTATSGQSVTDAHFYVLEASSTVSGTVVDSDGVAVTTPTLVEVTTEIAGNQTATGDKYGTVSTIEYTDEDGNFEVNVPEGEYYVRASTQEDDQLDPQPVVVHADEAGAAKGMTLTLVKPDATITGMVVDATTSGIAVNNRRTSAVGSGVESAFISAYSSDGATYTTETDSTGAFSVPANIGSTWYVTTYYQTGATGYYSETSEVSVTGATASASLALASSVAIPAAQSATFDPQNPSALTVADSAGDIVVEVTIPANTITATNIDEVTVRIDPTIQLAREKGNKPLSIGYEMTATNGETGDPITKFAGDVTVELTYSEADLTASGVAEEKLKAGYYEDSAETWRKTDGSIVFDTTANTMTVATDHFSTYAILSPKSAVATVDDGSSGSTDESGGESGSGSGGDSGSGSGTDSGSESDTDDGILGAPSELTVKTRTARTVQLDWTGDEDAASYQVRIVNAKNDKVVRTLTKKKSAALVKKLRPNRAYSFQVRAIGGTGSETAYTDAVSTRTLPTAPKALKALNKSTISSSKATATLKWKKVSGTIKLYTVQIYKGKKKVNQVSTTKSQLVLDDLVPGTKYSFRVRAQFDINNRSVFSKKQFFSTSQ